MKSFTEQAADHIREAKKLQQRAERYAELEREISIATNAARNAIVEDKLNTMANKPVKDTLASAEKKLQENPSWDTLDDVLYQTAVERKNAAFAKHDSAKAMYDANPSQENRDALYDAIFEASAEDDKLKVFDAVRKNR